MNSQIKDNKTINNYKSITNDVLISNSSFVQKDEKVSFENTF